MLKSKNNADEWGTGVLVKLRVKLKIEEIEIDEFVLCFCDFQEKNPVYSLTHSYHLLLFKFGCCLQIEIVMLQAITMTIAAMMLGRYS